MLHIIFLRVVNGVIIMTLYYYIAPMELLFYRSYGAIIMTLLRSFDDESYIGISPVEATS
jgi:hypothetical protein